MRYRKLSGVFWMLWGVPAALGSTMLMNGLQSRVFPTSMPAECMAAFNTSIDCDPSVGYLYKQHGWIEGGWQESNLTLLCTDACQESLQSLKAKVGSACGTWSTTMQGQNTTASTMIDFYLYKYNVTCLKDGPSFCLLEQEKWTLQALEEQGQVTWPRYIEKTYPDWEFDPENGSNFLDENGTVVPPFQDPPPANVNYSTNLGYASLDYWYNRSEPLTNRGWTNTSILEYDEYPLEIQCSSCFLSRFRLGFASRFGEGFDDVMEQVWANMQRNCGLDEELYVHPNLNQSGPVDPNRPSIVWTVEVACDRTANLSVPLDEMVTCNDFALAQSVPSRSLSSLNYGVQCQLPLANGTYCLPGACPVTVIEVDTSAPVLLQDEKYQNMTMVQFIAWNPDADLKNLYRGDVVCVGPPGGAYVPSGTTVGAAYPTVYTTTATPANPTVSGTIANCGLYYTVKEGEVCDDVTLRFSLTFDQFVAMNPSIDARCSNLLYGIDYCVAAVDGTIIPTVTSTATPPSTTAATTVSASTSNSITATVAAPTSTMPGTTGSCYKWYVVKTGDSCWSIYTAYGITLAQFLEWNTAIDEACSNLWPDYAYCVSGP